MQRMFLDNTEMQGRLVCRILKIQIVKQVNHVSLVNYVMDSWYRIHLFIWWLQLFHGITFAYNFAFLAVLYHVQYEILIS